MVAATASMPKAWLRVFNDRHPPTGRRPSAMAR